MLRTFKEVVWDSVGLTEPSKPSFNKMEVNRKPDSDEPSRDRFVLGIKVQDGETLETFNFTYQDSLTAELEGDVEPNMNEQDEGAGQQNQVETVSLSVEEFEAKLAEAFEQGQMEAQERLESDSVSRIASLEESWSTNVRDLSSQFEEYILNLEKEMLSFSLALVEKYVLTLIERDERVLQGMIRLASEKLAGEELGFIGLSDADLESLNQYMPQFAEELQERGFKLVADQTISRGCVFHGQAEELNFDLVVSFERLRKAVFGEA